MVANLLGGLCFGIVGGGIADRIGAPRGFTLGAFLRLLPVLLALALPGGSQTVWVVAFLYSTASQVFTPSEMALVHTLQARSPGRAHALLVALQYGGQGLGLAIAPALFFAGGTSLLLVASAAGFGVLVLLTFLLQRSLRDAEPDHPHHLREALQFGKTCRFLVREAEARYALVTIAIKNAVARGVVVIMPIYLTHDLGLSRQAIGFLVAPAGVGIAVGIIAAGRRPGLADAGGLMRRCLAGMIVGVFVLTLFDYGFSAVVDLTGMGSFVSYDVHMNTTVAAALPASFLLGLSTTVAVVAARTALSSTAPAGQQARVFAVQDTLTESLLVLPLLLTGVGTEVVGARPTLLVIGIVAVVGAMMLELPRFRRIAAPAAEAASVTSQP